jgi:hypothetical protein
MAAGSPNRSHGPTKTSDPNLRIQNVQIQIPLAIGIVAHPQNAQIKKVPVSTDSNVQIPNVQDTKRPRFKPSMIRNVQNSQRPASHLPYEYLQRLKYKIQGVTINYISYKSDPDPNTVESGRIIRIRSTIEWISDSACFLS